jgi:AbrB family looped-hinge helix DNA binding protein
VSERGTVTIPASIRKIANLHPGDLVEFETRENGIIIRQLIVKHPEEESFMSDSEWEKFDKFVKEQLKEGEYTSYTDLEKAKEHSRRLKE